MVYVFFTSFPQRARQCKYVINSTPVPIGSGNGTYVYFLPDKCVK